MIHCTVTKYMYKSGQLIMGVSVGGVACRDVSSYIIVSMDIRTTWLSKQVSC